MNRSIRGTLVAAVVAVVAMAFASVAGAAVTESHVNAPGSPHFSIVMPGVETVAVSGTSNGTTGDKVDLRCLKGTFSFLLAKEIPVAADGSFSDPNAELKNISNSACILRAVPTGPLPSSLATYTGPLMATGESQEQKIGSGPNAGRPYDYYAWVQQQTAAFEYTSAGLCGIGYGHLFDSSLANTTLTFACNDGFFVENVAEFDRSGILVDGANAYLSFNAQEINPEATNLPAFSYSVSQDPANGDTTIQESDAISTCSTATFPPTNTSCPSFVETGVRLDRTIVQSNDGHLATITDHFVSVDGKPHAVDTLLENAQYFGNNGANGEKIEYRFPGQTGYFKPALKQVVAFPDATPGTIYARVEGSPDGSTNTGRGAIVFADPSSPATFFEISSSSSEMFLHQTATVPAGGSATKRFAYAQAYGQAEVEALAHQAEAAFQPTPAPTPTPTPVRATPAPAPVVPSNKIKLLGRKLNPKKGTALLRVRVPGAGKLILSGRKVKLVKHVAKRAGTVKLTVAAKPKFAKSLAAAGKLKVPFKLAFTPTGGKRGVVDKSLTLVEK